MQTFVNGAVNGRFEPILLIDEPRNIRRERADCGHSPQVQNLMARSGEADIQAVIKSRFDLHRRKAASSPIHQFVTIAASIAKGGSHVFAAWSANVGKTKSK